MRVYFPTWTRAELVAFLKERADVLSTKIPLRRVVLFGSYARGRQTAASDVDLMVVYDGPSSDAYDECWDLFGIPQLELHLYSYSEYGQMMESGNSLVREAEREGMVIFGKA